MAVTKTEYQSVDLKSATRILLGRTKMNSIEAGKGTRLTRTTGDGRDDLCIDGPGIARGTEVPWSNVAGARRLLKDEAKES